ncbi:GLUG motif-containing protein [Burkholderia sp. Ac-20353]|uniref:two-partner secretion domain-containing protein n=1 Tax=Burkholderia sp. Ac-20353 TaxID=2703894 RepID=UPI00197B8E56|nr:GLUG motif-containing protein [Burkholderia sp. Ac-20353]MBN3787652.1 filamentous hemagglutinin N-terminal domain-containing protein [Burkholderia sp. Ac-20353]
MNKTYALVWNQTQRCWAAVGETARRRGKSSGRRQLAAAAVSLLGFAALPAFALPSGETIMSGKADIARSNDGKSMSINQHSDKLITNWQDFSVAGGERVAFNQPTSQSLALNRVIGNKGSQIDGQISANGRVFLVNPNGVMFGSGAQINVGGLVASTQNISDENFLAGNYRFSGNSTQSIVNDGTITAADGGSVALLGARVSNNGVIQAKMGRVALGAGNAFTVNFDGNGLLSVQVDGGAVGAQAINGGLLKADGGEVLMTARAAGNLLDSVVNNTGKVEARGLNAHGGKITLDGGTVKVAGKLDASAAEAGAPAGSVTTRGERVDVANDTVVDTRAGNTAGKWTIEAANAGVNGTQSINAYTLSRNLGTTNIELANTQGDLTVGGPVAWNSDNALTLTSKKGNVDLQQVLSATGTNARLLVNAANQIRVNDAVKLTGRNAHLELNAKNGATFTNDKAVVTLSGNNASFSSNGEDYTVLHTLADLRNVDQNLNGRYVLGNAIDGYNASFRSIGSDRSFFGVFNGLGNKISRLNLTNPGQNVVGLFAVNHGEIANLVLQNIQTSGTADRYGSPMSIGTLAGYNFGAIRNVTAKDVTVSARGRTFIGGLVGSNLSGSIERASVSGRVEGDRDTLTIGGLVGDNITATWPKLPTARISDSRAEVRVVTGGGVAGGLVGFNRGAIERSSSAGSVVATSGNAKVGGLVGVSDGSSVITESSSSVTVTAGQNAVAGGLVGENAGTIAHSRATGSVTAGNQSIAGGLVGTNGGNIDDSHAYGNVVAETSGTAGGFAGSNTGRIARSDASGSVKAGPSSRAGGFAAVNEGVIDRATATGAVLAGANSVAGGLVGQNTGKVVNAKARGDVTVAGKATIGGLAGANEGVIDASTAEGLVTAGNESTAGGLVGFNTGVVKQSSATGYVLAGHSSNVGGLIGRSVGKVVGSEARGNVKAGNLSDAGGLIGANDSGSISGSYAYGDVEAGVDSWVGGLIGHLRGTVDASHATGSAKGGDSSRVGGLIGRNDGTVKDSSSTGTVSGGRQAHLGGLVGGNFGYVNKSSTSSPVAFTNGYNQQYGALAGVNFRMLVGNKASGNAAGLPLVGFNAGTVKD